MEELKNKQSSVPMAEIARQETLDKMQEIAAALQTMDTIGEFDEGLFKILVERIRVID